MKLTVSFIIIFVAIIVGRAFIVNYAINNQNINADLFKFVSMGRALVLGILASFYSVRFFVIKPISIMQNYITEIASGDFRVEIPKSIINKKDEFVTITHALQYMQSSIQEIIINIIKKSKEVSTNSDSLAATSKKVSTTAQNLNQIVDDLRENISRFKV